MKLLLPLAFALTAGLTSLAQAQTPNRRFDSRSLAVVAALCSSPPGEIVRLAGNQAAARAPAQFRQGQRVELVGEISSAPKKIAGVEEEQKMQVAIGPNRTDYTLHLREAKLVGVNGQEIQANDLVDKMWIRAEGTVMEDPRRIKVTRLDLLGKDQNGYRVSRFWNPARERGFLVAASDAGQPVSGAAPAGRALPRFAEGTPVVVVGEVTSQPKDALNENKMQVGVGPGKTDVTLHLKDAKLYSYHGTPADENHLVNKMWVRAEGTVMDDPRRIKVTKLQVIGMDMPGLQRSAFYRPGFDQGYIVAVAGSRQIFPEPGGAAFTPGPIVIIGKVSDDTGSLETTRKLQVDAAGNTWTLHVPQEATVVDAKGEKISVHEVSEGQWVRIHGWQTDDLRLRVARLENIGKEEAYRGSAYFRTAEPIGYVERLPGTGVRFNPIKITGVVSAIDEKSGSFTLRNDQGVERMLYAETILGADGRPVDVKALRVGQRVTIQGSEILY